MLLLDVRALVVSILIICDDLIVFVLEVRGKGSAAEQYSWNWWEFNAFSMAAACRHEA